MNKYEGVNKKTCSLASGSIVFPVVFEGPSRHLQVKHCDLSVTHAHFSSPLQRR